MIMVNSYILYSENCKTDKQNYMPLLDFKKHIVKYILNEEKIIKKVPLSKK